MNKLILGIPYSGCEFKSEIPFTREDEVVAFAFGCELTGKKCEVFMQDNGYLLALDAILGLWQTYDLHSDISVNNREDEHHFYTGRMFKALNAIGKGFHLKKDI